MYLLLLFNTQLLVHRLPATIWCFTCSFRFFSNTITSSFPALGVKKHFLRSDRTSCISVCAHCLSLGSTEKSLAPSSLHLPFRYLCTLMRFTEPTFLHIKQSQLSLTGEMLQSLKKFVVLCWTGSCKSLLYRRTPNWTQHSKCGLTRGEGSPHLTCWEHS